MLRGGALFYALALAVVLAFMSGGLLLAAHLERLQLARDRSSDAVIANANSGLQLLLGKQQLVAYDTPAELDLFGQRHDSVSLTLRRWGLFDVLLSRAHNRKLEHRIAALAGAASLPNDNTALRMADLERPLGVCGKTILRGDCYLPTGGIRHTYVEGQNFTGERDVYGSIKTAPRMLPEPDKALLRRLDSLLAGKFAATDSLIALPDAAEVDSLANSFFNAPAVARYNNAIVLRNQTLCGNICIYSSRSIRVEASANLQDVLLIAPYIELADKVEGRFQALARDSLRTGKEVKLNYPSVLGIVTSKQSPPQTWLQTGEKCSIDGLLFGMQTVPDFTRTLLLSTGEETKVRGRIWCNELVDLRGTVYGDVSCKLFRLQTRSAVYENQLLNAEIDRSKRPGYFVLPALHSTETEEKRIARWLY